MNEEKDRKGTSLERLVADVFRRIGFKTELNVFTTKRDGKKSEQDVLAKRGNIKVLIQCKDYAKFPDIQMEDIIQDLVEDGESIGADKLVLLVIGLKNSNRWKNYAKEKGIYLWDEDYWRKLQSLDLIDLYEEVGKNLEIEEVLRRIKEEEEQRLKSIYSKIEDIKDKNKRKIILEELEKLEFSEYTKREIQLKKIENEIILAKEKETNEELEGKIEDIELEEIFSKIKDSELDFEKRYLILDKIRREIELSKRSGKLIDFEKIKTFIEKQQENLTIENLGDQKLKELDELKEKGKISFKDYIRLKEKLKQIGVSKKEIINSEMKNFDHEINKLIFLRKIKKTLIGTIIWAIITLILWRVLF